MPKLIKKKKRTESVMNGVVYVRAYAGERPDAIKNSKKPSRRKKPFRDKIHNKIVGEFSSLGRYRVN